MLYLQLLINSAIFLPADSSVTKIALELFIAVAAGETKVNAIIATEMNNENAVLVTDEAAANKIAEILRSHHE